MNKTSHFILANQIIANADAEAHQVKMADMWGSLAGMGKDVMAKASPYLDKGFSRIGQAVEKIQNPWMAKLLTGAAPNTGAMAGYAGQATRDLGRTVAKRVGMGTGGAYGGAVALEAPFKHRNNEAYEEQQSHPIASWLKQHLMGSPKLAPKGYLNPFNP